MNEALDFETLVKLGSFVCGGTAHAVQTTCVRSWPSSSVGIRRPFRRHRIGFNRVSVRSAGKSSSQEARHPTFGNNVGSGEPDRRAAGALCVEPPPFDICRDLESRKDQAVDAEVGVMNTPATAHAHVLGECQDEVGIEHLDRGFDGSARRRTADVVGHPPRAPNKTSRLRS